MYRVIEPFFDLKDEGYAYHAGDAYPRPGKEVSEKRLKELSTSANRRKKPLVEAVTEVVSDGQSSDTEPAKRQPRKSKQRK